MGALLKCNLLFLHIPKTGGSWVRHVLRDQNLVQVEFPDTHPDMERLNYFSRFYPLHYIKQSVKHRSVSLGSDIRSSYKFCFVRNPHKWYESYWRYMSKREWQIDDKKNPLPDTTWRPNEILKKYGCYDFRKFMDRVLKEHPGYLTKLYGRYAQPSEIDFVGRTESLVDDLITVLKAVGAEFDEASVRNTKKINTSPNRIENPEWDKSHWKAVCRLEASVFEQFGYDN